MFRSGYFGADHFEADYFRSDETPVGTMLSILGVELTYRGDLAVMGTYGGVLDTEPS